MSFQEDRRRAAHRGGLSHPEARRKGVWTVEEIGTEYLQSNVAGVASTTVVLPFTPRDVLAGKTYVYETKLLVKNGAVATSTGVLGFSTSGGPTVSDHSRGFVNPRSSTAASVTLTDASFTTGGTAFPLAPINTYAYVLTNGVFVCTAPGQITPQIVCDADGANITVLAGSSFTMKAIN